MSTQDWLPLLNKLPYTLSISETHKNKTGMHTSDSATLVSDGVNVADAAMLCAVAVDGGGANICLLGRRRSLCGSTLLSG